MINLQINPFITSLINEAHCSTSKSNKKKYEKVMKNKSLSFADMYI